MVQFYNLSAFPKYSFSFWGLIHQMIENHWSREHHRKIAF